jgi:hypothetical protein
MHKHLMDRYKRWIMKGWHAMCSRTKEQTVMTPMVETPETPKQLSLAQP